MDTLVEELQQQLTRLPLQQRARWYPCGFCVLVFPAFDQQHRLISSIVLRLSILWCLLHLRKRLWQILTMPHADLQKLRPRQHLPCQKR